MADDHTTSPYIKPGMVSADPVIHAPAPERTFDPAGIRTDEPVRPGAFSADANTPVRGAGTEAEQKAKRDQDELDRAVAAKQDALKHSSSGGAATKSAAATKPAADANTGAAKLRAFEDRHLGRRAMRNKDGHVERGFGSPFKEMSPEKHVEHAALERLVEAEARVDKANAELGVAKAAVETAKKAAEDATKAADAAAAEAKRAADEDARAEKPVEQKSVDPSPGYAPAPAPRLDAFGKPTDPAQKGL